MGRKCLKLAFLQFLNYLLIAMSIRFLAAGSYTGLALTDGAIAFYGFTLVQQVAKADSRFEQLSYTAGGILGSLLGLWLTRGVK